MSTLRDARSNLALRARSEDAHLHGGVHGVQGVAATGVTGAKQLISPLLRKGSSSRREKFSAPRLQPWKSRRPWPNP